MAKEFRKRWKGYSPWKKLGIITLLCLGLSVGFVIGYIKGSADMAQLVVNLADRAIDSANVTINLKEAVHQYVIKAGIR